MEKLGTLQHHDAITGTGIKSVYEDYYVKAVDALHDLEQMNTQILAHDFGKFGLEIKKLDESIMLRQVFKDKFYSPYQMASSFIVIAQNPGFSEISQLIQIECPYNKYSLYELDLEGKTMTSLAHDNFRSKAFINGKDEAQTIRNNIQLPVKFANFEKRKIYLIHKEKESDDEKKPKRNIKSKLNAMNQEHIDKSQSQISNFNAVIPGDSLKYGQKELKFLGLVQQEPFSQDHGIDMKTGKAKELDSKEIACTFEFIDHA